MEKRITGDTLQRYSFRKLSVGLVSATIGSFFLSTAIGGNISTVEAAEVSAGKNVPIQYHYVVESELTEAEKNAVVKELPKFVEENSDCTAHLSIIALTTRRCPASSVIVTR